MNLQRLVQLLDIASDCLSLAASFWPRLEPLSRAVLFLLILAGLVDMFRSH